VFPRWDAASGPEVLGHGNPSVESQEIYPPEVGPAIGLREDLRLTRARAFYIAPSRYSRNKTEPCRDCVLFRPPNLCALVSGEISPDGHCGYFERKE